MNTLKKIIVTCIITVASLCLIPSNTAYADNYFSGSCRSNFLGLTSWDCGVTINNENDLKNGVWVIAANVLTDITIIATYLIVGYTIYGGYLYVFSRGDPTKVANGKKTLTQAFIGLAIVILANVIMNSIRIALLGANGSFAENCATSECINASTMFSNAIQWIVGIAGAVSLIFIVYGGILYTTSSGEPSKLEQAKKMILYALIGLIIVAITEIIIAFVSNTVINASASNSNHQLISSKELHEKNI